jgi:hypothetical protein
MDRLRLARRTCQLRDSCLDVGVWVSVAKQQNQDKYGNTGWLDFVFIA